MKQTETNRLDFHITKESQKRFDTILQKLSKIEERKISNAALARMALTLGLKQLEQRVKEGAML